VLNNKGHLYIIIVIIINTDVVFDVVVVNVVVRIVVIFPPTISRSDKNVKLSLLQAVEAHSFMTR
jgi:hypothetical protein